MRKTINSLDIESSGFYGYPIQIGIIKENGETFESLIKPHEEWLEDLEWDYNSQTIHNLEKDYVIKNGRDIKIVAKELNDFCNKEDVFVDSAYDVMWLDLLFEFAEINRTFNIMVLGNVLPEDFMVHWSAIFSIIHKESGLKLHDALSDAIMNQRTFIRIAKYF